MIEFGVVTLIWGSTWLVIKGQLGVVPPAWSVSYRFLIASAALFVICLVTRRWQRPSATAHGFAAIAGVMQFMLNFNLVYVAEAHLTSGLVSLVFALLVVPNAILARVFLKTRISPRFAAGAAIGVAGLALVFADDVFAATGRSAAVGLALTVAAVLCASTANVMQASPLARTLPPLPTLTLTMAYGAVFDSLYAWATVGGPTIDPRPEYWLGLAYLAVFATVVAFALYYRLIRRIGPGPAAYSSVVVPIVAMTLSTVFEDFRWTLIGAGGAVLAVAGLAVALAARQTAEPALPAS